MKIRIIASFIRMTRYTRGIQVCARKARNRIIIRAEIPSRDRSWEFVCRFINKLIAGSRLLKQIMEEDFITQKTYTEEMFQRDL